MPVPGLPFTDGQLFQLTNAVLPAWVGLLLFPRLGVPLATAVSCIMSVLYIATLIGTFSGKGGPPALTPPPRRRCNARLSYDAVVALTRWLVMAECSLNTTSDISRSLPVVPAAPELAENPLALMTSFEGVAKLLGTRAAVLPAW